VAGAGPVAIAAGCWSWLVVVVSGMCRSLVVGLPRQALVWDSHYLRLANDNELCVKNDIS